MTRARAPVNVPACSPDPCTAMAWSFSLGNGFEATDQNDLYAMV
jgi:hypothetical protein